MKTVRQAAELSGVSVRTLHHYDKIGLLKPTAVSEAGYRLYDDAALERLHRILLLRELDFPLSEIKKLLDSPDYSKEAVLRDQLELLKLKRQRLGNIIALVTKMIENGGEEMDFSVFDKKAETDYAAEAKERWGKTEQYAQSEKKAKERTARQNEEAAEGLNKIFARFGSIKTESPEGEAARALAGELKDYITRNYYTCTDEILSGLGEMYTADERFKNNIDSAAGEGTAEFVRLAIKAFVNGRTD